MSDINDVLENLLKHDQDFSESKFKSKVENTFVQIKLSIVTGKIDKIDHFVNDEVYDKLKEIVQENINNNRIQIYDELNVAEVQILNIEELDDCFNIQVRVHSKALDYFIDKNTKKYLSGNNTSRTDRYTEITFTKAKDAKSFKVNRKCPSCGANIDVNSNGKCSYCHRIFNLEKYDWIITKMEL